jgi:C-terminal processing protease CtpA/Prc
MSNVRRHKMKTQNVLRTLLVLLALIASIATHGAEERGTFGFAVAVDVEGMFDHTLKSVVVKNVEPGLPAAAAGVSPGDNVLEVEGKRVQGSKASDIAALMKRKPGESITLKLKRVNGEVYVAALVAAQKP